MFVVATQYMLTCTKLTSKANFENENLCAAEKN